MMKAHLPDQDVTMVNPPNQIASIPCHKDAPRLWIYALGIGIPTLLTAAAMWQNAIPILDLFADPLRVVRADPFIGAVSNFSILVWFGTGMVCMVTSVVEVEGGSGGFFASVGILTLILSLDDMYQLHEAVLPTLFGLKERYPKALYLIATLAFVVHFRRKILSLNWPLLIAAGICFAGSLVIDNPILNGLLTQVLNHSQIDPMEDILKTFGIFLWSAFFLDAAQLSLTGTRDKSANPRNYRL